MFELRQVTDEVWDTFVTKQKFSPFVQSSTYGKFYKELGESYWILGFFNDNELIGGSLVLSTHAKRGNFLYLPYGPFLNDMNNKSVHEFFAQLKDFGIRKGFDFIRVSPMMSDTEDGRETLQRIGFRSAPMHVLAENSWILDLEPSEEELLKQMKKNHRNLIRRCEREGVTVQRKGSGADLSILHKMLDITQQRHNFIRFSRTYIDAEYRLFAQKNQAMLFTARLANGAVDAAAIIMFYGNMAVYRHSGSLNTDKKIPTSYLVQWEVIKEAKRRGVRWYNFWGINPEGQRDHPFAGIGHFKRGFGGFQKDLLHCHDLPLTSKYWLNWIVETIRAKRRGF